VFGYERTRRSPVDFSSEKCRTVLAHRRRGVRPQANMSRSEPAGEISTGTSARIVGPIKTSDGFGNRYAFYRCQRCGAESDRRRDLTGCCSR
jgi:hypothetical protein